MKISGRVQIPRTPAEVWDLLMDPATLRRSIPKCEELEPLGANRFRVQLRFGVGFVRGKLRGEAELRDIVVGESYAFEVRARGTAGSVEGLTFVQLSPASGGASTELHYESDARVAGLLASVGEKWFEGTARSLAERFFEEIARQ